MQRSAAQRTARALTRSCTPQLWRAAGVAPYALHATWMRRQDEPWKLMRLREQQLWVDPPEWYAGRASRPAASLASAPARTPPAVSGYVTYDATVDKQLLAPHRIARGALPLHHLRLMHEQLKRLRSALFVARTLGRALVLPPTLCACEVGFWISHVEENCRAGDHHTLDLPYICPIDHYLSPGSLTTSRFAHRERTFLSNPRTPQSVRDDVLRVRPCRHTDASGRPDCDAAKGEAYVPLGARDVQLVAALGQSRASVLHFDDVVAAFGGFVSAADTVSFHNDAQELLSSWCCTKDRGFKRHGGEVPYILPPLPGQTSWLGSKRLRSAAEKLAAAFLRANDTQTASEMHVLTT